MFVVTKTSECSSPTLEHQDCHARGLGLSRNAVVVCEYRPEMIYEPPDRRHRNLAARAVRDALRDGAALDDEAFDQLYPEHIRRLSRVHWTPMEVAVRAAELLAPEPGMRVLDVGAGPGKLCCVGALTRGGTWHGIEIDPGLVAVAVAAARSLAVARRIRFHGGDMYGLDWQRYDSLYLYNPFESLLFSGAGRGAVFADQVARAEQRLSALPAGTRVVTFHGFGGAMPSSFALRATERFGAGALALWVQQPGVRAGPAS
jgi:SAM-dependent methyltransferase